MLPDHKGERFPIIKREMRIVATCSKLGRRFFNATIPAPRKSAVVRSKSGRTLGVLRSANPASVKVHSRNKYPKKEGES